MRSKYNEDLFLDFDVANKLVGSLKDCHTLNEVVEKFLDEVIEVINVQIASIFLFDKKGKIKRFGINAFNDQGVKIDDFDDESYEPGEGFSARAVPKTANDSQVDCYGKPVVSNNIQAELSSYKKNIYSKRIGVFLSGVSIPLHGRNRTFGTFEVINKLNHNRVPSREGFLRDDIFLLTVISNTISTRINTIKSSQELEAVTRISQHLIDYSVTDRNFVNGYQAITDALIADSMPYTCCILRKVKNEKLDVVSISADSDISLNRRNNNGLDINEDFVVCKVLKTKEPIFISDLSQNSYEKYHNTEWIRDNGFKAHACYPLLNRNECVGTISIFTTYKYWFYHNEQDFIKAVSSLAASFIEKQNLESSLISAEEEIQGERDKIVRAAHSIGTNAFIQEITHRYKGELVDLEKKLLQIYNMHPSKREDLIDEHIQFLRRRIDEITGAYITPESLENIYINHLTKKVVRLAKNYCKRYQSLNVIFNESYDDDIGTIEANYVKIESVLYNIILNGINAIAESENKKGKIEISTGLIKSRSHDYSSVLQVVIADNGIGMDKKILERIFEKGFTTTHSRGGTGIGLFVCKEIVKDYNGDINVYSTIGKGTTFVIELPIYKKYDKS